MVVVNLYVLLLNFIAVSVIQTITHYFYYGKDFRTTTDDDFRCTLLITETLYSDGSESSELNCELPDDRILPILNAPQFILDRFDNDEIMSSRDVLYSTDAQVVDNAIVFGAGAKVNIIHHQHQPSPLPSSSSYLSESSSPQLHNSIISSFFSESNDDLGFISGHSLGTRKVLVIRVDALDTRVSTNITDHSDKFFGTHGDLYNMKTQFEACSFGKLKFQAADDIDCRNNAKVSNNGVYNLTLDMNVVGTGRKNLANKVIRKAKLDLRVGCLKRRYDHVAVCLPRGVDNDTWVAYAHYNSYLSVYNDDWCNSMTTQMHEFGHNLNIGHSGEGDDKYGDHTGIMGVSSKIDENRIMCFNAVGNWYLGWYSDRQLNLSPPYDWTGILYGIADYDRTKKEENIIIRLDDTVSSEQENIYISFNRATGINIGTKEGQNQVLIHSEDSLHKGRIRSTLLAKLKKGDSYTTSINGQTLFIIVDDIPDNTYAVVRIESLVSSVTLPNSKSYFRARTNSYDLVEGVAALNGSYENI